MSTMLTSLTSQMADKLNIESSNELTLVLKQTVFKTKQGDPPVSDAQMTALLIVANQYGLNPWTKEIYAYPDKGSIVPVIGVDGWLRIINDHPAFDGMEISYSDVFATMPSAKKAPEWCEVKIFRKDRTRPTVIREYLDEVYQNQRGSYAGPWQTHTKRFLRHKTIIQCGRAAFGFSGVYDADEADRILEKDITSQYEQPAPRMSPAERIRAAAAYETVQVIDTEQGPSLDELIAKLNQSKSNDDVKAVNALAMGLSDADKAEYGEALDTFKEVRRAAAERKAAEDAALAEKKTETTDEFLAGLDAEDELPM
ncbi:phage recombination protein Bet [Iodobacter phage PhiPLPE]|uniref:Phage recombination protein Bet n=1 Tax=Iodobacter phage PhiPLPE TaxID=551895 RepID=B5AX97_9CAUD|nr:RecT-like ssDNA annealing protein [Iodobacter phage PhiPLPE]ACG60400.1 phage recombination protein Bet [Iodobacter phage PhiPLPE]